MSGTRKSSPDHKSESEFLRPRFSWVFSPPAGPYSGLSILYIHLVYNCLTYKYTSNTFLTHEFSEYCKDYIKPSTIGTIIHDTIVSHFPNSSSTPALSQSIIPHAQWISLIHRFESTFLWLDVINTSTCLLNSPLYNQRSKTPSRRN